jgi:hypothetical protein
MSSKASEMPSNVSRAWFIAATSRPWATQATRVPSKQKALSLSVKSSSVMAGSLKFRYKNRFDSHRSSGRQRSRVSQLARTIVRRISRNFSVPWISCRRFWCQNRRWNSELADSKPRRREINSIRSEVLLKEAHCREICQSLSGSSHESWWESLKQNELRRLWRRRRDLFIALVSGWRVS